MTDHDFGVAVGAIPSGLFIATVGKGEAATGFLASFVQQVGFEPLSVAVAVGKDRAALQQFRDEGCFCLAVLDEDSKALLGHFARGFAPGEDAFDGIDVEQAPSGTPYPKDAMAWMDCKLVGEVEWADHVLICGEVTAGDRRDGKPYVHVRKTGRGY